MSYKTLEEALEANPKKKGMELFSVFPPSTSDLSFITWPYRWIWARSKADAVSKEASRVGYYATKYHMGAEVESSASYSRRPINGNAGPDC